MIIRDATIADMNAIAGLYYQFWNIPSNVSKMEKLFAKIENNSAYILLCAEADGRVVGSVMGIVCEELYGECLPFLLVENMIIDSAHRKRGIGKALFAEIENRARIKGCRQVLLVTESERKDAIAFYASIGFHPDANRGYKKKL